MILAFERESLDDLFKGVGFLPTRIGVACCPFPRCGIGKLLRDSIFVLHDVEGYRHEEIAQAWVAQRARAASGRARAAWAQVLTALGGARTAADVLQAAAASGHPDPLIGDAYLDALLAAGEREAARAWLVTQQRAAATRPHALAWLAGRAAAADFSALALDIQQTLLAARPDDRSTLRRLGLAAFGAGQRGLAERYLQRYLAHVDDDPKLVTDVMMAVGGRMSGTPLPESARPAVEAMAKTEGRVVLRCRPYSTFAQPPRHLHRNDQEEEVTHWVTASMPWDAGDDEPAVDPPAADLDPEAMMRAREREDLLARALATLPPEDAVIVSLKFVEGLTRNQIQRFLHLPELTEHRVRTIVATLRARLSDAERGEPAGSRQVAQAMPAVPGVQDG